MLGWEESARGGVAMAGAKYLAGAVGAVNAVGDSHCDGGGGEK